MALTDFTQLDSWKRAMDLAAAIHELTKLYPKAELYGLVSQMRRAALLCVQILQKDSGDSRIPIKCISMSKHVVSSWKL